MRKFFHHGENILIAVFVSFMWLLWQYYCGMDESKSKREAVLAPRFNLNVFSVLTEGFR